MKKRQANKINKAYAKFCEQFPFDDTKGGNNITNVVAQVFRDAVERKDGRIDMHELHGCLKAYQLEEHRYKSNYPHLEQTYRYRKIR